MTRRKVEDYLICENFSEIIEKDIILYGVGYWGEILYECLSKLNKTVYQVCNSHGSENIFHGHKIFSLEQIFQQYDKDNIMIIVASTEYYKEMIEAYMKKGFRKAKICTLYAFFLSIRMHVTDSRIPRLMQEEIKTNLKTSELRFVYYNKLYALDMFVRAAEEADDHILIFQPGKVGSQSIWNSIRVKSVQFHTINVLYGCKEFAEDHLNYYLNKLMNKQHIKIITAVREPIARDISAMFQNSENEMWPFSTMNGNIFWWYGNYRDGDVPLTNQEIIKRNPRWQENMNTSFNKIANIIIEKKLDEFTWYDNEIKNIFGIDIYNYPFDKEAGYSIIKENNIEILILKMEKLSNLVPVITEFIQDKTYQLESTNMGHEKIYSYVYKELKKHIKISSLYYDYYYHNNEKMKHFYTSQEIELFRKKWRKHIYE